MVLGVLEARLASVDRSAWAQQDRGACEEAMDAVTSSETATGPAPPNGDVSAVIQAATDLFSQGTDSAGIWDVGGAADMRKSLSGDNPRTDTLRT